MSPLEIHWRELAASLDVPALEGLASKGLVRRAQKDLDRGVDLRLKGEAEGALQVLVDLHRVTLPPTGPALATCSCPAQGICQHIIAAVLFLRGRPSSASSCSEPAGNRGRGTKDEDEHDRQTALVARLGDWSAASSQAAAEWMAITPAELEAWAGKKAFQAGLRMAGEQPVDVSGSGTLRIRFAALNAECHVVAGGGLDGVIVSGGPTDGRALVVAAVIGFQQSQGRAWTIPAGETSLAAGAGAPRTRHEILQAFEHLLVEALASGLARLSAADEQRWATLAMSALGVQLPRLALGLRGVADEVRLALAHDARADLSRLLGRLASLHALGVALRQGGEQPRPDLVGWHRTHYAEVGHLDLLGVSAWPWRTASGYEGLTVLLWDAAGRRWNSWSEARPRHSAGGFDPVRRYTSPGPWNGVDSPRHLARSAFRLMHARRNGAYRLSGSSRSRALVTGKADAARAGLPVFSDWKRLVEQGAGATVIGLKDADPLASVVAVCPSEWGERGFDPVRQVFGWRVTDTAAQTLRLELGFDDLTRPAVEYLEGLAPASLKGATVIGRFNLTSDGPRLHPYSLLAPDGSAVHLALDSVARSRAGTAAPGPADEAEWEEHEAEAQPEVAESASARLLGELDDLLLALAERGLAGADLRMRDRLTDWVRRAEGLHLLILAQATDHLARHVQSADALLRCAYLSELHRRALGSGLGFRTALPGP